jgi:hypothetical protein
MMNNVNLAAISEHTESQEHLSLETLITTLHASFVSKRFHYWSINSAPRKRFIDVPAKKIRLIGVLWRQIFRILPINLRSLVLQSRPESSVEARIVFAYAYLLLNQAYKGKTYQPDFESFFSSVLTSGNEESRYFAITQSNKLFLLAYSADICDVSPLLTCWAGFLFLEAFSQTNDITMLTLAKKVGNFFVEKHPRSDLSQHALYFHYVPNLSQQIFNCSAMISAFLLKLGRMTGEKMFTEQGEKGINHIVSVQNRRGFWFYGDGRKFKYVDNFHTAFVLIALGVAREHYRNKSLDAAFWRGLQFYRDHLFERISPSELQPIHFLRRYPPINSNIIQKVDLRDAAAAIILFSCLGETRKYLEDASHILRWTLKHMKQSSGFSPEITWLWRNRIPYLEFQAYIFLAIVMYYRKTTIL